MDARTIELKVDAINWTMLGFGKVCSVICELADRSAYFFTVEQFLGSKDISVNDLLAAFKGDSSQTKMNLMNFASMKAPINDMTVRMGPKNRSKTKEKTCQKPKEKPVKNQRKNLSKTKKN